MTTFAAQQDTERRRAELDARIRTAWAEYRAATQELAGAEYDDVETASWDQLQATVLELERERAALPPAAGPR
jgi:hypothetical protein